MTRKGKLPPTEDALWAAFLETDEVAEYIAATDKISEAIERGEEEVSLPTAFLAKRLPQTIPFHDEAYVVAWNRVCDEAGKPGRKKPLPEAAPDPMVLQKDIKVRSLRLKKSPAGEED